MDNNEIHTWESSENASERRKTLDKQNDMLFKALFGFGEPLTEEQKLRNRLKYAYVIINGEKRIGYADNETQEVYACSDPIYPVLKEPLEKVPNSIFIRWCSTMDL